MVVISQRGAIQSVSEMMLVAILEVTQTVNHQSMIVPADEGRPTESCLRLNLTSIIPPPPHNTENHLHNAVVVHTARIYELNDRQGHFH